MTNSIVAYDPGPHCGIAWRDDAGVLQATMIYDNIILAFNYIRTRPRAVVVEDFQTKGNISKDGLYTVRLIGGIQAMCLEYKVPLTIHIPQARYLFLPEARVYLRSIRGRKPFTDHELDATAHLLTYESRSTINGKPAHVTSRGALHPPRKTAGASMPQQIRERLGLER